MSQQTICDVCGKEVGGNYDYSVSIGNFKSKMEVAVTVTFKRCGISGISRWEEVDLCCDCKELALRIALKQWNKDLQINGKIEHYPPPLHYKEGRI